MRSSLARCLGVDTVLNYRQGGLIAYDNDDLLTSHVAIWNTRNAVKEMPFSGGLRFGRMLVGP